MFLRLSPRVLFSRRFTASASNVVAEKLSHRGLLRVQGEDGPGFLQGLVTADVHDLVQNHEKWACYSHLLNVKGRVMYDLIIYKDPCGKSEESLLLEADADALARLAALIKMYRVKRKISIEKCEELAVWNLRCTSNGGLDLDSKVDDRVLHCRDPRLHLLGWRLLVPSEKDEPGLDESKYRIVEDGDPDCYRRSRYELGVPEGTKEISPGNVTPLEYNLDILRGVSFNKGCYIGQELTARTKHTGVIRKRIMPMKMTENSCENEAAFVGSVILNPSGKNVGRIVAAFPQFHLALGLIRFAIAMQTPDELRVPTSDNLKLSVHVPDWWPEEVTRIQEGGQQESKIVKKDGGPPDDSFSFGRTS